jgi:hypothetical protein
MENYKQLTREEKSQFWQDHFNIWKGSSLTQKKYCEENSISYWNFRNRFGKGKPNEETNSKKFIKLKSEKIQIEHIGKIEIIHGNKIRLLIEEGISEGNFRKIFSVLVHSHD